MSTAVCPLAGDPMTAPAETRAEPTWLLRQAIHEAIPETFSDDARAVMALHIGVAVAEHLLAELDGVEHATHYCIRATCGPGCDDAHECGCPLADVRDLLRVRPPE